MQELWLLYLGVFVLLFFLLRSAYPRRQYYRFKAREIIAMESAYLIGVAVSAGLGARNFEPILWGLLLGLVVYIRLPRRSRHVPAAVRRRAVARYEMETGKKFNSRTHEVDHVVPFRRGGSHTFDNLRVIEKSKNRSKGAKSPWWDVLGR